MTEKAPTVDQDGKMINPHNPEFITKVPWYLGNSGPTLKHHNIQKADHFLTLQESDELINKKIEAQKRAAIIAPKTVYRKGACKNCGAMSHKEKDCVERPRSSKKAAWKSGLDIAPDEVALKLEQHGKVNYSTKRDQWKGYNPDEYDEVVKKHERISNERKKQKQLEKEKKRNQDEEKRAKKIEKISKKTSAKKTTTQDGDGEVHDKTTESDSNSDSDSDSEYDSDEEHDDFDDDDVVAGDSQARDFQGTMAPQGGIGGNGMRVTVRNLRIREDTPKYLRNLALDSAFYDPKSRSMRSNPLPDENPEDLAFAGDNFVRHSGDALKLAQNQVLCWEMQARGENIDVISNPSQAELLQRQFVEKKKNFEDNKKKAILDKYTDGKTNESLDNRLKLGQTEAFLNYGKDGKLLKHLTKKPVVRTKYEEDNFINNHTSVWGSYFNKKYGVWGFQCCHSTIKNSYCTGKKGKEANDTADSKKMDAYDTRKMLEKKTTETANKEEKNINPANFRNEIFGESNEFQVKAIDTEKLKAAYEKADREKRENEADEAKKNILNGIKGGKKREYNSMKNVEVTVEDMEVYRLKRQKEEDPMAKFMDSEELLEYKK